MPRGQLRNYKVGNRSYSITQLLGYGGVHQVVSSRSTEGSKRELLRDLLRRNVITPQMLTNKGAAGPSTYGAQRARAGEPIRTNTGVETEVRVVFTTLFTREIMTQVHLLPWAKDMVVKRTVNLFKTAKVKLFTD